MNVWAKYMGILRALAAQEEVARVTLEYQNAVRDVLGLLRPPTGEEEIRETLESLESSKEFRFAAASVLLTDPNGGSGWSWRLPLGGANPLGNDPLPESVQAFARGDLRGEEGLKQVIEGMGQPAREEFIRDTLLDMERSEEFLALDVLHGPKGESGW